MRKISYKNLWFKKAENELSCAEFQKKLDV